VSIEKKSNGRYLARWRDPGGNQRAQSFDRKIDADRFLATVTVDQLQGRYVDPSAGRLTVEAFARQWASGEPWRESTRASRETVIEHQISRGSGACQPRVWPPRVSAPTSECWHR
jgi:hypothetical protein